MICQKCPFSRWESEASLYNPGAGHLICDILGDPSPDQQTWVYESGSAPGLQCWATLEAIIEAEAQRAELVQDVIRRIIKVAIV